MKWFEIEALDLLFFRRGQRFDAGTDTFARSVFPPHPSTLYGLVQTTVSLHRDPAWFTGKNRASDTSDIGRRGTFGTMSIVGPLLKQNGTVLVPVPADLSQPKDAKPKGMLKTTQLTPIKQPWSGMVSSFPDPISAVFVSNADEPLRTQIEWMSLEHLADYLHGKAPEQLPYFRLACDEPKIGIKISSEKRTVKEGLLYTAVMKRVAQLNEKQSREVKTDILFGLQGVEKVPEQVVARFGGEGRTVIWRRTTEPPLPKAPRVSERCLKLYLLTPAVFANGWFPDWLDEDSLTGKPKVWKQNKSETLGVEVQLVAAAVKKSAFISGWDLAHNRPKPSYRIVPAGSVYILKAPSSEAAQRLAQALHLRSICLPLKSEGSQPRFVSDPNKAQHADFHPNQGWGIVLVGKVPLEDR